ncbi:MAG: hypothetical protein ACKOU7_11545 [Ferruginibacter sp.]
MENRTDILNELRELSVTLAGMEKVNVFTVPDGYFDCLGTDILLGVHTESGLLNQASAEPFAQVPEGYFENLAGSILSKIKAQDIEADSLPAELSGIRDRNVFEVPPGYFEALPGSVLANIQATEADDRVAEIRALSPMLYSIQNERVFEVPPGFFEVLPGIVLNKVNAPVKVVSMKRRTTAFFKYAVAAAFTGMMALSVFKFTGSPVENTELPAYVKAGMNDIKDVDQELAKVSDEDIVKYLEANGTDVKTAMVANSIDANELPSQEDYLLDEKALDKYLSSINVNDLKN